MRFHHRSTVIRPSELADELGVSSTTLWRWRKTQQLPPAIHLGPHLIGWRREDIDSWLANKSKGGNMK